MFKSIPKSNISNRSFKAYKLWNTTEADSPIIKLYNVSGSYFDASSPTSQGYYVHSLYNSIKKKYYSSDGNAFTTFGSVENLANYNSERQYPQTVYAFSIQRSKFGEQIKPNSVELSVNGLNVVDNGYGQLKSPIPTFTLESLDMDSSGVGLLTITNGVDHFELEILDSTMDTTGLDLQDNTSPGVTFWYQGVNDTITLVNIDFELGNVEFLEEFQFEGTNLAGQIHGNVFYDDGLIVLTTQQSDPTEYTMNFRSTHTIYETEILVSADSGEFNYSQNPSAVDVVLSGSYDFETTAIPNVQSAKNVKIKEILDIKQKSEFLGSVGSNVGTWEDYYNYGLTDPTGSYLSTYITTIGLYDDDDNLLVVAKLPKPIKNLPDYNVNFLVRFDT